MNEFNSVIDRALAENGGSCLMAKKPNGKYSLFLPVTNLGELGSAPGQISKTVVGNKANSSVQGRKESSQQSLTFFAHRDNFRVIESYIGKTVDLLRVLPDFTGYKYSATIDRMLNDTGLDSAEQGAVAVTITVPEEYVDNVYDLIEDTVVFTNDIPQVVTISGTGTSVINVTTNPASATITATSETSSIATATYSEGKVTITGVTSGSAVIKLTATSSNYNSFDRTILVIVK